MEAIIGDIQSFLTDMAWISWTINIAIYAFTAFCLQTLARKTDIEHGWLAWIPIANIYIMCKIAGKPGWWTILFFIPIVNIVFLVIVWMGMAEARDKNKWLGFLAIVPVGNLIFLGYLAFSGGSIETRQAIDVQPARPNYLAFAGQSLAAGGEPPSAMSAPVQTATRAKKSSTILPRIEDDIDRKKVRLVMPLSSDSLQVAQLKEGLNNINDLSIVMTGGAVDEGLTIAVSVPKETNLLPIIADLPVVGNVQAKGEDIIVKLKSPDSN